MTDNERQLEEYHRSLYEEQERHLMEEQEAEDYYRRRMAIVEAYQAIGSVSQSKIDEIMTCSDREAEEMEFELQEVLDE